jgi:chemotaxis methyl-accepting protein methylase
VGVLHQRADHQPDVVLPRGASLSAAGRARQEDRAPYSVWCAAASTGEEPYSIAITLAEALGERAGTVLATDIDTQVLAKARSGIYTAEQVSRLSQERLKRFFLKGTGARAGSVKVKPELAATITFEPLNLLAPDWGIARSSTRSSAAT